MYVGRHVRRRALESKLISTRQRESARRAHDGSQLGDLPIDLCTQTGAAPRKTRRGCGTSVACSYSLSETWRYLAGVADDGEWRHYCQSHCLHRLRHKQFSGGPGEPRIRWGPGSHRKRDSFFSGSISRPIILKHSSIWCEPKSVGRRQQLCGRSLSHLKPGVQQVCKVCKCCMLLNIATTCYYSSAWEQARFIVSLKVISTYPICWSVEVPVFPVQSRRSVAVTCRTECKRVGTEVTSDRRRP